jgi:DtxR family Mn-dependent transcriptional regulator
MVELSNIAEEFLDEILEVLWVQLEEGGKESVSLDEIVVGTTPVYEEPIKVLEKKGLVKIDEDQIQLTDSGFEEARRTIRRHRLSERMFLDIFEITEDEIEEVACRFEHSCHRAQTRVDQMVVPMSNLRQGESGAIAYVHTGDSERLKKLMALGILPGESVTLQRRYPSFVFTVGQSRYAVDEGMASAIYVKRVDLEEGAK